MATKDIGNLRTRLSWEDEGASRSLEGFRRDLKGLRSELNLVNSHGKKYTSSLKGMREQSDILTRRLQTQQERVRELKRRYDESVRVKGEDAKQTKDLAAQYNNATAEMNRTEQQLERLNAEIKRMESPWTQLGEHMTNTGEKMQEFGRMATDFGRSYSMRVTAPIVAGGVAVFKASMDYESAFAGVRKTVDATEEEFQALSQGIREMTKILPASAVEIASVGEAAGQLGIETENILSFTRTMIDLGEATNMTAETAATQFARFANIVGMSQKDFDRLGSVVVELGNNLATTEAEIVDMAMRLAGAGAQIGLTEAEIMAFSGALSSVGIAAEAGGSAFSKVMINMQLAAEMGGEELEEFAKVAGVSAKEFKDAFEKDAAGAIIKFIEGLSKAEERGTTAIAILDEMGITEVRMRDALLRASGAYDVFNESVEMGTRAWKENVALTEEAEQRYGTTESQLKIMWNRVRDVAITLGDALAPAVMEALDAAKPLIEQIESGAKAFAEMDEEQQQTILKMIAFAAAIGPASVALGGMTTTIGGVLKVGGSLSTALGSVSGAGLLGKLGIMAASAGPVILAAGAVGVLGAGIYQLSKNASENTEEIYKSMVARREELDEIDNLISAYEKLHEKNQLNAEQMLRYMDILTELEEAETDEAIKKLTEQQEELLKWSGLTREEMEEYLKLNDTLVEKMPTVVDAISDQGNAYISVIDNVKELNEVERQRFLDDTYIKITNEQREQTKNIQEQIELQQEISDLEFQRSGIYERMTGWNERIREIDKELIDLENQKLGASSEQLSLIYERETALEMERTSLTNQVQLDKERVAEIDKQISGKQKTLEEIETELEYYKMLIEDYEQMLLLEYGITSEKGKTNEALREAQDQLDKNREELKKLNDEGKITADEFSKQNRELREQQELIDEAKDRARSLNESLSEEINKTIRANVTPSPSDINWQLSQPVNKKIQAQGYGFRALSAYADGTDYHPGGPFIAGEEGWELGRLGNRWELLNFGLYDRPAGYEVFPHDESKRILNALNNIPGYATGARASGEASRVVNQLNQPQTSQPLILELHLTSEIDGMVAGQAVERYVTEIQERNRKVVADFAQNAYV